MTHFHYLVENLAPEEKAAATNAVAARIRQIETLPDTTPGCADLSIGGVLAACCNRPRRPPDTSPRGRHGGIAGPPGRARARVVLAPRVRQRQIFLRGL
ncbi:hypothetical protein MCEREM30_02675 [Paracoccaceae bacterium]